MNDSNQTRSADGIHRTVADFTRLFGIEPRRRAALVGTSTDRFPDDLRTALSNAVEGGTTILELVSSCIVDIRMRDREQMVDERQADTIVHMANQIAVTALTGITMQTMIPDIDVGTIAANPVEASIDIVRATPKSIYVDCARRIAETAILALAVADQYDVSTCDDPEALTTAVMTMAALSIEQSPGFYEDAIDAAQVWNRFIEAISSISAHGGRISDALVEMSRRHMEASAETDAAAAHALAEIDADVPDVEIQRPTERLVLVRVCLLDADPVDVERAITILQTALGRGLSTSPSGLPSITSIAFLDELPITPEQLEHCLSAIDASTDAPRVWANLASETTEVRLTVEDLAASWTTSRPTRH